MKQTSKSSPPKLKNLNILLANCKLIPSKVHFLKDSQADIIIVTESWYKPELDPAYDTISQIEKAGYQFVHSVPVENTLAIGGVGLLVKKKHPIMDVTTNFPSLLDKTHPLSSRCIRASININNSGHPIEVVGVYAPCPKEDKDIFIQHINGLLNDEPPEHPLLVGGDWNTVTHPEDGEGPSSFYSDALAHFPASQELTDCFRHLHPLNSPQPYVYTNKNPQNNRRLDQLFCSNEIADRLVNTSLRDEVSTHFSVNFKLKWKSAHNPPPKRRLTNNFTLSGRCLKDPRQAKIIEKWIGQFLILAEIGKFDPIQAQSILKATMEQKITQRLSIPEAQARRLRQKQGHNDPEIQIPTSKTHPLYINTEDQYNPTAESKKATKYRAGHIEKKTVLNCLYTDNGTTYDEDKIIDTSYSHYSNAFSEKPISPEAQTSFFKDIPEDRKLSQEEADELDSDFTLEELAEAINHCQQNKSNGPDGFPFEFYQQYLHILKDHLLAFYNYLGKHGVPTHSLNNSHITLIPKQGKDQKDISNWRPISLMNTDMKIFSHLINNRLKLLIPNLVHPDQSGFVYQRVITTNLDTLDQLYYSGPPWTIGLIDFAKAFDSISHSYIQNTLEAFGIGPNTRRRIAALQTNANSKLLINDRLSPGFNLECGVRQGCPLSPSLFALGAEPLLIRFRSVLEGISRLPTRVSSHHNNFLDTSITRHHDKHLRFDKDELDFPDNPPHQFKLAAFADDIAIFFNSPEDIINTGKALKEFRQASALAINPKKTIIQEVPGGSEFKRTSINSSTVEALNTWEEPPTVAPSDQPFKYLGIHFGPKEKVRDINREFLEDLKQRIIKFPLYGLDTKGKCWILSTFVISKIIYKLAFSSFTKADFQSITDVCCDKVNDRLTLTPELKPRRRKHSNLVLTTPTTLGGFGLLDLSKFGPNSRLVRAARVLGYDAPAAKDFLTQHYNQGAYAHLTHNPLLEFSVNASKFVHPSETASLKRNREQQNNYDDLQTKDNAKKAARQNAFTESTLSNDTVTYGFPCTSLPEVPKLTRVEQNEKKRSQPNEFFDQKRRKKPVLKDRSSFLTYSSSDTWASSTSPSFHMALEELASYLKRQGSHLVPWQHKHLNTESGINQRYLYAKRKSLTHGGHTRAAYPSPAEVKHFRHHLKVNVIDNKGERKPTTISPAITKPAWKDGYDILWSDSWILLGLRHHENDADVAETQWKKSFSSLFALYCKQPKLADFLQYLMINKLTPLTTDWPNFPHFKNTKKGCGICNHDDLPSEHTMHALNTHIFCECPVVRRALSELLIPNIRDLADLGLYSKRIKEPDKPKLAYAIWQFERALRRLGADGHNRRHFEAFKQYILYTLKPGNRLITFSTFNASSLA